MPEVLASPTAERPARRITRTARVVLFWGGYLAVLIGASLLKGAVPATWAEVTWGSVSTAALLVLTWSFARWEGQPVPAVEAASAARLGAGALLGIGLFALNVGLVFALAGPVVFTPVGAM